MARSLQYDTANIRMEIAATRSTSILTPTRLDASVGVQHYESQCLSAVMIQHHVTHYEL